MDLKEYLKDNKITVNDFAEMIGVHRNHISGIINKRFVPGITLARHIAKITKENVTVDELIPPKEERVICPCCKRKLPKGKTLADIS
jgi:transcriptional regulator with XRE-family HTH domain